MADLQALLADLHAEGEDLDAAVSSLPAREWARPTPADGWDIARQIAHLSWTDDASVLAANDANRFQTLLKQALTNVATFVDDAAAERATRPVPELLATWRAGRAALVEVLAGVPEGAKLPWFGPQMSAASMATARIMETWAHGQDVADALGVTREATARIRHVAHIGVRTRDFAYVLNDRVAPAEAFRVELGAPDGEIWTWGPYDAAQRVDGPALDFCLLVTQRRHRADLALRATGSDADEWLGIAQAFAGPPGTGRESGQFA